MRQIDFFFFFFFYINRLLMGESTAVVLSLLNFEFISIYSFFLFSSVFFVAAHSTSLYQSWAGWPLFCWYWPVSFCTTFQFVFSCYFGVVLNFRVVYCVRIRCPTMKYWTCYRECLMMINWYDSFNTSFTLNEWKLYSVRFCI